MKLSLGLGAWAAAGIGASALARYIAGDRTVAARLLSSSITHVPIVGDSRMVSMDRAISMSGLSVGGLSMTITTTLDQAGVMDAIISIPVSGGNATGPDTLLDPQTVGSFSLLRDAFEIEFLGGTSSSVYLLRRALTGGGLFAGGYGAATLARFAGHPVTAKVVTYDHPLGLQIEALTLAMRVASTTPSVLSTPFSGYSATGGWSVHEVDYQAYPVVGDTAYLELGVTPSTVMTSGEMAHFAANPWVELPSIGGPVFHDWAIGGASIERFLDDGIFPTSHWSEIYPLMGSNRGVMIALGTNNPAGNDRDAFVTKLGTLVSRYRAGTPDGDVVLVTSYPAAADTDTPYYVSAAIEFADKTPGVICLDTYSYMPSYVDGVAAGYYGDTVHYSATGKAAYGSAIRELLEYAAR